MDQQLVLNRVDLQNMLQALKGQRQAARQDLANVSSQLADLKRTILALDQAIAPLAKLLGEVDDEDDDSVSQMAPIHADAVEQVMRQRDRRWRVAELVRLLEAINHPLPEGDVQRYTAIHSALKRRPQTFRRVARGLWVLVGSEADKASPQGEEGALFDNITDDVGN